MGMRALSAGVLSAICSFLLLEASGCGTDAVGVDECRDIEKARCEAGAFCGLVEDVDACKRFYRDQCLHGLATGERPGKPVVDDCVKAIERAGSCAQKGIKDLADCPGDPPAVTEATLLTKVCDVVKKPEQILECDFLGKPVEVPDAEPDAGDDRID